MFIFIAEPNIASPPPISQEKLEKKFGQSPVFVTSTLLEEGGVLKEVSSTSLLKEAIHVISCGYEDKTEWGKEVNRFSFLRFFPTHCDHVSKRPSKCSSAEAGWVDLRLCHGRYTDGVQDALPWLAINLLHA